MSMASLAERLNTLRREDGQPDIEARQAELTKLIQSLPGNELRFLKHQLNPYTFQTDICGKLPPELLLQVCAYLDLEEFMKARCVSRQWYKAFSESNVLQSVARTASLFAPKTFNNAPDQGPQINTPPSISDWLPQAASKRIQRLHGQYTSVSARQCSSFEDDDNSGGFLGHAADKQYCGGRVAYSVNDRTIAVTDLRTDITTTVMDENRIILDRWHLSEQFVVAISKSPPSILAFPLVFQNGDNQHRSVRLPSPIRNFFQYQDLVGVITMAGEVLIWNIGGDLRSLDISIPKRLASFKLIPVGITFHPEEKRNVFVIFTGNNRVVSDEHTLFDPVAKIIVQEHQVSNRKAVLFHEFDLFRNVTVDPDEDYSNRQFLKLEDNSVGIGIIDMVQLETNDEDDKEYYRRVPPALPSPHPCQHNVFSKRAIRSHPSFGSSIENHQRILSATVVVKFNTRLKVFSAQCYHLPTYLGERTTYAETDLCDHALFWRNQMVFSYPRSGNDTFTYAIIGLNDCGQPTSDQCSPPSFYGHPRPQCNTSWTPFTWLWYKSKVHDWTARRNRGIMFSNFRGDDEFVVWLLPYGYFVWYFGKPPKPNSALLETPTPPVEMEKITYDEAIPESDDDEVPIGELAKPLLFHSTMYS